MITTESNDGMINRMNAIIEKVKGRLKEKETPNEVIRPTSRERRQVHR
jgi:hypothetical protein